MRFIDIENSAPLRLKSVLRKRKKISALCRRMGIDLLFLHGSLARDRHGPLSDVDIALTARRTGLKKSLEMSGALSEILEREDIDLVLLNRASPLISMQVLNKGIPLYVKSRKILTEFRYQTIRNYLDTQRLYSQFERYVVQAVL